MLPHPTLFAPWLGAHAPSPGLALAAGAAQGAPCLKARAYENAPEPNSPWALRQAVAGSTQLRHSEEEEEDEEEAGSEGSEEEASEEEDDDDDEGGVCGRSSVGAGAEQRLTQALRSGAALGANPGGMQE